MKIKSHASSPHTDAWQELRTTIPLTDDQESSLRLYCSLLQEHGALFNLTAILDEQEIVRYHFIDSLMLATFLPFKNISCIGDVGTGAGFPGIPLAIVNPHLSLIGIEVTGKKIDFLRHISKVLHIENQVHIVPQDWRTFLRKENYPISCFVARASLQPEELIRAFAPGSVYRNTLLAYWAAYEWIPSIKVKPFVCDSFDYNIGLKKRKIILLQSPEVRKTSLLLNTVTL